MKIWAVVVVVLALLVLVGEAKPVQTRLNDMIKDPMFKKQFKQLERILSMPIMPSTNEKFSEMSVECALCGIVVNELEGFIAENASEAEIEQFIRNDICVWVSGFVQTVCDELADQLPTIIGLFNSRWTVSQVCVTIGICEAPFTPYKDPEPVPQFIVDLDQPPTQRWSKICSIPQYRQVTQFLTNTVNALLPNNGSYIEDIGYLLNTFYLPTEYAQEIQGCASQLGVSVGWATLFNLGYEVSDACTSIVAQTNEGKIYHARNMDFWAGMGFTDSLKNITMQVTFTKGGKAQYTATMFAGYVGVLSGIKNGAFSLTIDTRFYPGGLGELFYEVIAAIVERNASLVSFLSRQVLEKENDFESAVYNLANSEIIADVYYITAGVSAGQGAVISRNRMNATDIWRLDATSGRWFEVETNYDHWEPAPWFDDRRGPANAAMNALGRQNLSLQGMFQVLSVKPVLNIQTTYTILACPADSSFSTVTRWCPYPCVE